MMEYFCYFHADDGIRDVDTHVILACFFFFQAEDGIRDADVTGVQTCALPICARRQRGGDPPAPGRAERPEAHRDREPRRPHGNRSRSVDFPRAMIRTPAGLDRKSVV